eukprot:TRINITY_DN38182_c0_g1_i1.p1 TRINITY_DN38182_c0_g1~~TRINITY_DN38182_c0_g1_i1.p1  ORF type:complete len:451 (+),score=52.10 TRINITY_DN38182_c0_g1_i1:44-1354(+)
MTPLLYILSLAGTCSDSTGQSWASPSFLKGGRTGPIPNTVRVLQQPFTAREMLSLIEKTYTVGTMRGEESGKGLVMGDDIQVGSKADSNTKDSILATTHNNGKLRATSLMEQATIHKATVIMNDGDWRDPVLRNISRKFETLFDRQCDISLYYTPMDADSGVPIHQDSMDVLVLQAEGSKRWHLWENHPDTLTNVHHVTPSENLDVSSTKPTILEVHEGEMLFIPRGVPHKADTVGLQANSLHLSIGIEATGRTLEDFVLYLIEKGAEERSFLRGKSDGMALCYAALMKIITRCLSFVNETMRSAVPFEVSEEQVKDFIVFLKEFTSSQASLRVLLRDAPDHVLSTTYHLWENVSPSTFLSTLSAALPALPAAFSLVFPTHADVLTSLSNWNARACKEEAVHRPVWEAWYQRNLAARGFKEDKVDNELPRCKGPLI